MVRRPLVWHEIRDSPYIAPAEPLQTISMAGKIPLAFALTRLPSSQGAFWLPVLLLPARPEW